MTATKTTIASQLPATRRPNRKHTARWVLAGAALTAMTVGAPDARADAYVGYASSCYGPSRFAAPIYPVAVAPAYRPYRVRRVYAPSTVFYDRPVVVRRSYVRPFVGHRYYTRAPYVSYHRRSFVRPWRNFRRGWGFSAYGGRGWHGHRRGGFSFYFGR